MSEQLFLTVDEAAALLRVSRSHLYNQLRNGTVKSAKIGRRILIPQTVVDEMAGVNGGGSYS